MTLPDIPPVVTPIPTAGAAASLRARAYAAYRDDQEQRLIARVAGELRRKAETIATLRAVLRDLFGVELADQRIEWHANHSFIGVDHATVEIGRLVFAATTDAELGWELWVGRPGACPIADGRCFLTERENLLDRPNVLLKLGAVVAEWHAGRPVQEGPHA